VPAPDPVFIGVDLAGTNIEAVAVRNRKALASRKEKTRAEKGVDTVLDRIEETVRKVIKR
jgi:predicted NBD/HSP70 family sugar kinase